MEAMATIPRPPRTIFEVFESLPEGTLAQLINNQLVISPAPSFTHLRNSDWWKKDGLSLVLLPEAIVESVEIGKVKRRSLELAGLQLHHGYSNW